MELIVCLHANLHCIFYLESTCEVTIAKQCTIILINGLYLSTEQMTTATRCRLVARV